VVDRFIITGLPRSRTSWLANLFTYGSSLCMHDGLTHGKDFFNWLELMRVSDPRIRHMGNSDSGIPLAFEAAPEDVKVVVVQRNWMDCMVSFRKYFSQHPYTHLGMVNADVEGPAIQAIFQNAREKLTSFMDTVKPGLLKVVDFADLNDPDAVESMWNFLVPDEPFSWARWQILDKLRVNPASEKVRMS
jgi:hypothetical protein